MRLAGLVIAAVFGAVALPFVASAQTVGSQSDLKPYNVTILRFDPAKGASRGETFVLPVDSPDEEHAIASTIANASAFSKKVQAGQPLAVAFMAVRIEPRR